MKGRSRQECCSSQRWSFLTSQGLPASGAAHVLLGLWWNLPERAGGTCTAQNTWNDSQGSTGLAGELSWEFITPELRKTCKNFQESLWNCRLADNVPRAPGLQGRALLQLGKVTMPSPEGKVVFLSLSKDSDCSEVFGAGYSILAKICDIPYTAVMRGML